MTTSSSAAPPTEGALHLATLTLWGECRGEPEEGQAAVAWVIRTRAEWSPRAWWGHDLTTVVLCPKQFSCWDQVRAALDSLLPTDRAYQRLHQIMVDVMADKRPNPAPGATHYERVGTGAAWAKNREFSKIIGRHAFYVIGPGA